MRALSLMPSERDQGRAGVHPDRPQGHAAAVLEVPGGTPARSQHLLIRRERRSINMLWIIGIIIIAIVALAVLSFALHLLFSPWLLLVALGILAWVRFRPRRSRL